jgi:hypothetical protein
MQAYTTNVKQQQLTHQKIKSKASSNISHLRASSPALMASQEAFASPNNILVPGM